ncbi:MAG: Ig-like domain-containing protein [Reichenbachiella sp.]
MTNKLTNYFTTLLISIFMVINLSNIQAQLISEETTIEISSPLSINYTVSGSTTKRVNLDLNITSVYANFSILSNGVSILDNIDIPSNGNHVLNALVVFPESGEVELILAARTGAVTINSLSFEDVNIEFPSYTEISEEAGLATVTGPGLKYKGPTIADMDNDGDYDMILVNHNDINEPTKLIWNNGNGTVSNEPVILSRWDRQDLHGSAAGDFDNDGDLDILTTVGGGNGTSPTPPTFWRNDDGNFVLGNDDVGITSGARGRSAVWGDYDLDNDLDLILFNAHWDNPNGGQHVIYKNNGRGGFDLARIDNFENAAGDRFVMTDLDGDHIDDFVIYFPLSIWKGNGDFTFTNITNQLPVNIRGLQNIMAAADVDIDNDGDMDLYFATGKDYFQVANKALDYDPIAQKFDIRDEGNRGETLLDLTADGEIVLSEFEHVYRSTYDGDFPVFLGSDKVSTDLANTGEDMTISRENAEGWPESRSENGLYIGHTGDGNWKIESVRLTDVYWSIHWSVSGVSSLTTAWDPNNKNKQDVLLRNDNGTFVDVSNEWNIPLGGNNWGVIPGDFNNDGHQDLFINRFPFLKQRVADYMLINNGEGKFEITTSHQANTVGGSNHGDQGAAFDFDLDGDVDILDGSDEYGSWHLFGNEKLDNNNYVIVKVNYSPYDNVDPISAEVTIKTTENEYFKRVGSAGSVHSQSVLNLIHFGLGTEEQIESISVRWRNGESVIIEDVVANKIYDTDDVDPTSITINPATAEVREGTFVELTAIIEPINANNDVTWLSSAESVLTVDQSGKVTAVGNVSESATITARSNKNGFEGTSQITIVEYYEIPVESVEIVFEDTEMIEGETMSLTAVVLPKYADDKSITWSSSNEGLATVDENGKVAAISTGNVIISATSNENDEILDELEISIIELLPASLEINDASIYTSKAFVSGGEMTVRTSYHAGTGNLVSSGDGGIRYRLRHMNSSWGVIKDITLDDANAIGTESGTSSVIISLNGTTPSADLNDGEFYFLFTSFTTSNGAAINKGIENLTIIDKADLTVDPESATMHLEESMQLNATLLPDNLIDLNLIWSSSDESIATVDENGKVSSVAPGVTNINVEAVADPNSKVMIEISVEEILSTPKEILKQAISIYPNPSSDHIYISGIDKDRYSARVYDVTGVQYINQVIQNDTSISLSGLPKGVYVVIIESGRISKKFSLIHE